MPHVTHDGAKIYWEETGAGEPLLLIHGLGATLEWWERLMPLLTSSPGPPGRFRTIRMDNRGVGRSDVPSGPYSIAGMAAMRRRCSTRRASTPPTCMACRWAA